MSDLKEQFALEHYKFILLKIQYLDGSVYKSIGLYSKLITSVFAFLIAAILAEQSGRINTELLPIAFNLAKAFIIFLSSVFLLTTLANMFSWHDYRTEELILQNYLSIDIGRKKPNLKNFYRWTESWFILTIIMMITVASNLESLLISLY